MTRLRASRHNHLLSLDGDRWAFQGRTGALVRLDEAAWDLLTRAAGGSPLPLDDCTAPLQAAGFLVDEALDEVLLLRHLYYLSNYGNDRMELVIAPTMACNLACAYCFQAGRPAAVMNEETAEAVVGLTRRGLGRARRLRVTWYGGEPLLAGGLIDRLSTALRREAARRGAAYEAQILTNGTGLTPEVAAWLRDIGVIRAQVTLDGPAANHDRLRPLRGGGKGTWQSIVDHVRGATASLEVIIRCTLSGDPAPAFDLCRELDEQELPPGVLVQPAPLFPGERCGGSPCQSHPLFMGRLLQEIAHRGRCPRRLYLDYPETRPGCIATSARGYVVDPYGDVHRCLETVGDRDQAVGNLLGDMSMSPSYQRWLRADPFLEAGECPECVWLPQCFGSCPRLFLRTGGRQCTGFRDNIASWIRTVAGEPHLIRLHGRKEG